MSSGPEELSSSSDALSSSGSITASAARSPRCAIRSSLARSCRSTPMRGRAMTASRVTSSGSRNARRCGFGTSVTMRIFSFGRSFSRSFLILSRPMTSEHATPYDIIPFSVYPQPDWNGPDSIAEALKSVVQAWDKESSLSAYNKLLYAVGNNHAGTYYPVAFAIMPDIEEVLNNGEPWPKYTALEALIDLYISFMPQPGHETYEGVSLSALRQRILALKHHIEFVAQAPSIASDSARNLLKYLGESATRH